MVPPHLEMLLAKVSMSDERPSYPLVSVASNAQAIFSVTQADSRLRDRPSALSALRVLSLLQGVLLRLDSECTAVESLPLLSTQQASNTLRRLRCEVQSKMCPTLSSRLSCWQRRCQARQAKQSVSVFHQKVHSVMIEVPKLEPCHPLAKKIAIRRNCLYVASICSLGPRSAWHCSRGRKAWTSLR